MWDYLHVLALLKKSIFFIAFSTFIFGFLYGFLAIKWHLFDDFYNFLTKQINQHPIDRPRGWDLLYLFGGKLCFFTFAFIIPCIFFPFLYVLAFYLFVAFLQGLQMAIIFQVAHCNLGAEFPMYSDSSKKMSTTWTVHQLETTADFARNSRFLSWYLGGLNFQVEHHLFTKICHINYPGISRIVENTCKEYNVTYSAYDSFISGLRSHYQWLRQMGQNV